MIPVARCIKNFLFVILCSASLTCFYQNMQLILYGPRLIKMEFERWKSLQTIDVETREDSLENFNWSKNCTLIYDPNFKASVSEGCWTKTQIGKLCVKRLTCSSPEPKTERNDVTLVTQLTFDRISALKTILGCGWSGWLTAAVYMSKDDLKFNSTNQLPRQLCSLHPKLTMLFVTPVDKPPAHYPVNAMRTLAVDQSLTQFVFHLDVDFKISKTLHDNLMHYLNLNSEQFRDYFGSNGSSIERRAFIVPAFESHRPELPMPQNKTGLQKAWNESKGPISTFHKFWKQGQGDTNYGKWKTSVKPYEVKWTNAEPWVMTAKSAPRPDIRFVGRNLNKKAHIFELQAKGYKLTVLPDVFIVHYPHPKSADQKKSANHFSCMLDAYRKLLRENNDKRVVTGP